MKQTSLGLGASTKRTRRREFLDEMERVVPWADLVALVSPYLPEGKRDKIDAEKMIRMDQCVGVLKCLQEPYQSVGDMAHRYTSACDADGLRPLN